MVVVSGRTRISFSDVDDTIGFMHVISPK